MILLGKFIQIDENGIRNEFIVKTEREREREREKEN